MEKPDRTPDWIKQDKQAETDVARQAIEQSRGVFVASMTIGRQGPDFWKEFVAQVKINTDALEKNYTRAVDEKIVGYTSTNYDLTHAPDWSCDIRVNRLSVKHSPDLRQLQLYYRPKGFSIRRVYQLNKQDQVDLTVVQDEVRVEVNGSILTAKEFADHTVKSMVDQVKFPVSR